MNQHGTQQNVFFQNSRIDFSAAVNFCEVPDSVMQAARSGLTASMHNSREDAGTLEDCIAEQDGVEREQVFCGSGASEVAGSLIKALKPKKVLIPAPGFEEYMRALSLADCSIVYYYTKADEGFRIQPEEFCSCITQDIDAVFLCNPSNPTAVLYEREFVEKVLQRCARADALLILDECFLDFVEEAGRFTMKPGRAAESLFLVKDFTKMFAMPGIRLGYGLCADRSLMEALRGGAKQGPPISMVAKRAGIACTKEREFVRETVHKTAEERAWLLGELERIGITGARGAANFIFFASRPRLHVFSIMRGIMLRSCSNFEGLAEGYYRIAVRGREENEKLIQMLEQWQEQA